MAPAGDSSTSLPLDRVSTQKLKPPCEYQSDSIQRPGGGSARWTVTGCVPGPRGDPGCNHTKGEAAPGASLDVKAPLASRRQAPSRGVLALGPPQAPRGRGRVPLAWAGLGIRVPCGRGVPADQGLGNWPAPRNREEPGEVGVQQGKCSPFSIWGP